VIQIEQFALSGEVKKLTEANKYATIVKNAVRRGRIKSNQDLCLIEQEGDDNEYVLQDIPQATEMVEESQTNP
jgi:hypothetical protein